MILAILVFNCLVVPYLAGKAIEDVDYGTFMTMTENGEIGKVQIQQNQIVFTDKEESAIYRTGVIEDPGLVEQLHASGATFTSEIIGHALVAAKQTNSAPVQKITIIPRT